MSSSIDSIQTEMAAIETKLNLISRSSGDSTNTEQKLKEAKARFKQYQDSLKYLISLKTSDANVAKLEDHTDELRKSIQKYEQELNYFIMANDKSAETGFKMDATSLEDRVGVMIDQNQSLRDQMKDMRRQMNRSNQKIEGNQNAKDNCVGVWGACDFTSGVQTYAVVRRAIGLGKACPNKTGDTQACFKNAVMSLTDTLKTIVNAKNLLIVLVLILIIRVVR